MPKDEKLKISDSAANATPSEKPVRKAATPRRKAAPPVEETPAYVEPPRPRPANARWYAIHTYSGHEAKVARNIILRAVAGGMSSKFGRTFIPEEEEVRVVAGKTRKVKRKIFPGYVFLEMLLDDSARHLVKDTIGVTGFLSSGDKPIPLKDHEVRQLEEMKEGKKPPRVEFEKGDIVRVTSGPFAEFTGKIDEVMIDKQKLKVLIELFGRDTPVELAFNEVDKEIAEPVRRSK